MKPRAVVMVVLVLGLAGSNPGQETRNSETDSARIARLAGGTEKEALAALFYLEDARSADVAAWRLLLGRRDEPRFLARAVRGLGRVGEPELKPLLVDLLDGYEGPWTADVQRALGLAVGLFGDSELLPKLAAKATPRDVFFALGLIKKLPAQGRDRILDWKDANAAESRPAPEIGDSTFTDPIEAALRWGAVVEEPALADLAKRMLAAKDTGPLRRHAAVDYFARSKSKAPADVRPAIQAMLQSGSDEVSGLAARALAKSEGSGEAEAAAIEAAFLASSRITQVDQVRALSTLQAPKSYDALTHMLVLSKADPAVRRTVLESLKTVASKMPEETKKIVAATVIGILEPDEKEKPAASDVQAAAVSLLAAVDPAQFTARLPQYRLSAIWQVRAAAAGARLILPDPRLRGERGREGFLRDPDRRVRIALLEALAEKPPRTTADDYFGIIGDLFGWGGPALRTSDPVEIGVTASLLDTALDRQTDLHPPSPKFDFDWFPAEAARLVPHHEVEALQAVLDLAAKLKSEAGNAVLRGYLKSPEISLRKRAKHLLTKNGIPAKEEHPVDDPAVPSFEDRLHAATERANGLFDKLFLSVVIETNRGNITISLFPADAPATVENFHSLAEQGFYDGILWHRVVPAFVAQAGCPRGDGWGGRGHTIGCEINDRTYRRGSVGMALAGKDTGGSQFFICHRALPHLDGRYTLFGQVTAGMDVVDKLGQDDYILRIREL